MTKQRKQKNDDIVLRVPAWAARLYVLFALILLPWTVYLGASLPTEHLSAHWDISWTGLDIALVAALLATGLFAYRRSIWVVIAAASAGSLLLVDAWFDVTSERSADLFREALLFALLIEIPLALMSYYLAGHALQHNKKNT
ncbi:MAG: hypothetical protein ABI602_04600 [Candidatus Saccharibacteria bacterium]